MSAAVVDAVFMLRIVARSARAVKGNHNATRSASSAWAGQTAFPHARMRPGRPGAGGPSGSVREGSQA